MGVYTLFSYLPAVCINKMYDKNHLTLCSQIGDSNGLSPEQSSFLISMIGITNTIGRVIFGWLTDMPGVSPLMVNLVATFISTLFPILLSFPYRYSAYLAISATLGLSISPLPTVTSGIITDMLGSSKLNDAFGKYCNKASLELFCVSLFQVFSLLLEEHLLFLGHLLQDTQLTIIMIFHLHSQ